MTQQIMDNAKKLEKPVTFYVFVGLIALFVIVYIYLINGTVMHAVDRNSAQKDVRALTSSMSDLEAEYLSLEHSIDLSYAQSLGFKEVKGDTAYVSVGTKVGLSFNSGI